MNNMKTSISQRFIGTAILAVILLILVSSCAHKESLESCLSGHTYGFWGGLWHGIIAPIDFLGMLFNFDVTMFAQNNNGAWYSFGFLIGSGGWGFLGGKGITRKAKKSGV
jgi:hypothetical protein